MNTRATSVAYLGPEGTFTEEAALSQPDYAAGELVPLGQIADVLEAVASGRADVGVVPYENVIEGSIREALDALVFDYDLLIQREIVVDVHLHLLAPPGSRIEDVRMVASIPVALAQCRKFLAERLPDASLVASTSTAEAARALGEGREPGTAAVAPGLAAEIYGLTVLAEDVEDHPGNQTRFVALARRGVPAPTGLDRTSVVCFQHTDRPGSLHGILGQFAARNINLTRLESRPTKRGLGDYCFVIDFEGHLADEVVADCLRDLHAELAAVKFLGSYPAAGAHHPDRLRRADQAWREADAWLQELRDQIEGFGRR